MNDMKTSESATTNVVDPHSAGPPIDMSDPNTPKLGKWALLVAVIIIVGLVAGFVPRMLHKKDLAKDTQELSVSTVETIHAKPGKATASLLLPAEVKAFQEAPIYARASGFIKKWYVDIGAVVTTGQLLADIDTPELDQQLSGAKAELVQAEAAESLAKITADRWAELLKTASVSEQEHAEKQADLKLKVATVDAAKANVHRLEDLQSFTHVLAPFPGTLTLRDIDTGDLISPGKELFRLADTGKLRVFVRVPQTATPGIAPGVGADITVPEFPGRLFAAKVARTAGAIDSASRTLLTELEVENPRNEILPGSYAQVSFHDVKIDPALVLPANAFLFRSEGMQVGVVGADGRVKLQSVVMGRDFGRSMEVLSGITAEDKIIVNPADSLVSGTVVRIAEAPMAAAEKVQ